MGPRTLLEGRGGSKRLGAAREGRQVGAAARALLFRQPARAAEKLDPHLPFQQPSPFVSFTFLIFFSFPIYRLTADHLISTDSFQAGEKHKILILRNLQSRGAVHDFNSVLGGLIG